MSVPITICGNTTGPVDLQFGPSGAARCSWTLAVNSREKQADGSWADGPATYYRCTAWRQLAENVAATCGDQKSTRLVVHGRFKSREYEVQGQKRLSLDVEVEHVGPDLRFTTAVLNRVSRESGGQSQGWGSGGQTAASGDASGYQDPWGSAPSAGQQTDTEPPF